jgi:hypothetical protein
MLTRGCWIAAAAAMLALAGCSVVRPAPVVQGQTLRMPPGALKRIAVLPFSHRDTMRTSSDAGATTPEIAAELVARFMTEAMNKRGIQVIPASDLSTALSAQGLKPMDINPRTASELAAAKFGATAIMIGQVSRYRERQGEKFGSTGAASVAFNATIYATRSRTRAVGGGVRDPNAALPVLSEALGGVGFRIHTRDRCPRWALRATRPGKIRSSHRLR